MMRRITCRFPRCSQRPTSITILVVAAVAFGGAGAALQADDVKSPPAPTQPAKSLDDQLLENLGPDPLTENDLAKPTGADAPAKDEKAKPAGDGLDQELLKGLTDGEDAGQLGEQYPLGAVNRRMREVEALIANSRSGRATQQLQSKILQDLDDLIKEQQKQCQGGNCKPGGKSGQKTADSRSARQPGKQPAEGPTRESAEKLRNHQAARPDMADMKDLLKGVWGQLPEHQREQMLQSYEEQFLPKYEQMIADYFRSIAAPKESARPR